MTDNHPITPPPELIRKWAQYQAFQPPEVLWLTIATQAARWGADQELEACREEILDGPGRLYIGDCTLRIRLADDIWTARRPKPPSLAEEALSALKEADEGLTESEWPSRSDAIHRALERLQELEGLEATSQSCGS